MKKDYAIPDKRFKNKGKVNFLSSLNVEVKIHTFNVIYLLKAAEPDKFALLLPYMGSFIKFLGGLSDEASPKVIALGLVRILSCSTFVQKKRILNFHEFSNLSKQSDNG